MFIYNKHTAFAESRKTCTYTHKQKHTEIFLKRSFLELKKYPSPDSKCTVLVTVIEGLGASDPGISCKISISILDSGGDPCPLVSHVQTADFQSQDQRQEGKLKEYKRKGDLSEFETENKKILLNQQRSSCLSKM